MSVKNWLKDAFSYYEPVVDKKGADVMLKKMTYEDVAKEIKELNRIIGWRGVQAIDRLDKMTDILKSFDSIVRKVDERLGVIECVIKMQVEPSGKIVAKKKPKRGKR